MTQSEKIGQSVDLVDLGKREMRAQFAALPWRRTDGRVEVCIVTSRDTGRWIVPKGWPMDGKTPSQAAAIEAFEEAGLAGIASTRCIGVFTYVKEMDDLPNLPVLVALFPVEVTKEHAKWPEASQRKRKWVPLSKAARLLYDPQLREILLDPDLPAALS